MNFTPIDLARLPDPQVIEVLTPESIFETRKARLAELAPHLAPALEYESEGLTQLLQEDSYREWLLRQAVQDAGKGNMLAFAPGAQLDHLAAFYGVQRQVVEPAKPDAAPPVREVLEGDTRFRSRVQLAPESFTTCGTIGSYIFWTLEASPDVKDASVSSPTPGLVDIAVLSQEENGSTDSALLELVTQGLEGRRPLCDLLNVRAAEIIQYQIHAALTLYDGFDSEVVRMAAEQSLNAFVTRHLRLGHDITISGLHAALHLEGVQRVDLGDFDADLMIAPDQAAYCSDKSVTVGGFDV
ncbi:baseplate J/gp47 family protein [Thalassobius sp. I31.1]|uniref:baseplate assembly protein n=1 Tax=Thalassobius sp. I31.1 TaxID=2109912 RepID=UPI000D1AE9E3|nr:baseplate J/gp47 family protein [Thalassobius sp. I31.1]